MEDGGIPKDILCGELALGRRTTGSPHLRYKDVCLRYMKYIRMYHPWSYLTDVGLYDVCICVCVCMYICVHVSMIVCVHTRIQDTRSFI